jgi:hypothetical protein
VKLQTLTSHTTFPFGEIAMTLIISGPKGSTEYRQDLTRDWVELQTTANHLGLVLDDTLDEPSDSSHFGVTKHENRMFHRAAGFTAELRITTTTKVEMCPGVLTAVVMQDFAMPMHNLMHNLMPKPVGDPTSSIGMPDFLSAFLGDEMNGSFAPLGSFSLADLIGAKGGRFGDNPFGGFGGDLSGSPFYGQQR